MNHNKIEGTGSKYQKFIAVAVNNGSNAEDLEKALSSIDVYPGMVSIVRVIENLLSVIDVARSMAVTTDKEIGEIMPWRHSLREAISNTLEIDSVLGKEASRASIVREKSYHPLYLRALTSHPFYSMLATPVFVEGVEAYIDDNPDVETSDGSRDPEYFISQYRLLQWHLIKIYAATSAIWVKTTNVLPFLRPKTKKGEEQWYGQIERALRDVRDLAKSQKLVDIVPALNPKKDTLSWLSDVASAYSRGRLDSNAQHIGIMAKAAVYEPDYRGGGGGGSSALRRRTTAIYVDYPHGQRVERPTIDVQGGPKGGLTVRKVTFRPQKFDHIEFDLLEEEFEDEEDHDYSVEPECKSHARPRDQVAAAIGAANHRAIYHQHLPLQEHLLSAFEVGTVLMEAQRIIHARRDLPQQSGEGKLELEGALLAWLTFWLGVPVGRLRKMDVGYYRSENIRTGQGVAYFADLNLWRIEIPKVPLKKDFGDHALQQSRHARKHVFLPEVTGIGKYLAAQWPEDAEEPWRPFQGVEKTYVKAIEKIFESADEMGGFRFSVSAFSKQLFLHLATKTDPIHASYITGEMNANVKVQRHYGNLSRQHLVDVYKKVVGELAQRMEGEVGLHSLDDEEYAKPHDVKGRVGATYCPQTDVVKATLKALREEATGDGTPVERHNAFALYTVFMIGYMTGYRAIRSMDASPSRRDPETGLLRISDKDDDDFRNARDVWLPPLLEKQLMAYEEHLERLWAGRELLVPGVRVPDKTDWPYLFVLSDGELKTLSPGVFEEEMRRRGYYLPMNSWRRFLYSELSERHCPADIRDAFMGHAAHGQEAHGRFACLSPRSYRRQLQRYLEPIWESVGLQAIEPPFEVGA